LRKDSIYGLTLDDKTFRFSKYSLDNGKLSEQSKNAMIFIVELVDETNDSDWWKTVEKKCESVLDPKNRLIFAMAFIHSTEELRLACCCYFSSFFNARKLLPILLCSQLYSFPKLMMH